MDYRIVTQIMLELALAISGEQKIDALLKKAVFTFLRKLDCIYVSVWQWENKNLTLMHAAPKCTVDNPHYNAVVSSFEKDCLNHSLGKLFLRHNDGTYYYCYPLRDYGLLILGRGIPCTEELTKELLPIVDMLAQNCIACYEVSKREEIEKSLRKERSFLKALIDTIPDLIFYKDNDGVYQLVNEATSRTQNTIPDNIIGLTDFEMLSPEIARKFRSQDIQILASGIPGSFDTHLDHFGRKQVPYETTLTPFYGENETIQGIIGIARDISKRKEFEDILSRRMEFQKLLMNLATDFVNVDFEEMDQAIDFALKSTGEYTGIDRAYLFAYDFEAGLMHNTHEWCAEGIEPSIELLKDVPCDLFLDDWVRVHQRGENVHVPDVSALPKDSNLFQILNEQNIKTLVTIPLMYAEQCLGFIGFDAVRKIKDWGEEEIALLRVMSSLFTNAELRKRHEKEIIEARKAAEALSKDKSTFLANMSHEIRTPLNGIVGMNYLLQETPLNKEQLYYLSMIDDSVESLLSIINNILDLSKMEANQIKFYEEAFNLEEEVYQVVGILAGKSLEKRIEIIVEYLAETPKVFLGDNMRVRQILLNLVGNAVKFTEQGHVLIRVSYHKHEGEAEAVQIEIEDTGIGISPTSQEEIFNQFTQEDDSSTKKYGGTGLGLAISKQLAEMMNGGIAVRSQLGQGATFIVNLQLPAIEEKEDNLAEYMHMTGIKVLIVEDHAINRRILKTYLNSWGVESDTAHSGIQAIHLLEQSLVQGRKYDLALVDWAMPEMDGLTLGKIIRTRRDWDDTKLIMLTSIVGTIKAQELKDSGYQGILTKPFPKMDLYRLICQTLQHQCYTSIKNPSGVKSMTNKECTKMNEVAEIHVLLVDDHDTNRKAASLVLAKRGYHVLEAESGYKAIDILLKSKVDIILMDVQMPEIDGYETTRRIRKMGDEFKTIPIIALTANALAHDRERCLNAGMNDHIAKPFKLEELTKIYETYLQGCLKQKAPDEKILTGVDIQVYEAISATKVFDEAEFLKRYEDDTAIAVEVMNLFLEGISVHVREIKQLIQVKDVNKVRKQIHDLKGSSAYASALQLEKLSQYIIQPVAEENWKTAKELLKMIEEAGATFYEVGKQWLKKITP